MSRSFILWTTALAALFTLIALGAVWVLLKPSGPPLTQAGFSATTITPNADGEADIVRVSYTLNQPATVSIYFLNAAGHRFDFRQARARDAGIHTVDFSGVVAPFHLPTDAFAGEVLARALPDGMYTWVIEAHTAEGASNQLTGALTVQNADTLLPELLNLTVSPPVFTPNQDGLSDRETINVYLTKDIPEGGLHLFLVDDEGARLPIGEKDGLIKPGQRGLHTYDYDGGIDQGLNPPPDGTYSVLAEAEDALGQKIRVSNTVTIKNGGLPRADILKGQVDFSATAVRLGDTLYFTLTVENYGPSPIRTSGPPAGTVYTSMDDNPNRMGWYEQSGAWRVGLDCDTCTRDYPWRWALGTLDTLHVVEEDGQTYYYVLPGERAVVTGGVVLDEIVASRNPQYFWAGLIHEDVEISGINNRVDPHLVEIIRP